jgi:hypothetical protein
MRSFDITPNTLRVADFLAWQRAGTLDINPPFQRRSVWKRGAKGYLIDTVARGLPIPLIFLRERVDLDTQEITREVVDGQQRLRTLFAFIDPACLKDFDEVDDVFTVQRNQNVEIGGKPFHRLSEAVRTQLLGYKFSVQTLPVEMDDRDVLQVFARINSTGVKLNSQELRNAAYFGEFKTVMYSLAYEQFERWRKWKLLRDDQLSRMIEVELTSDLVANMLNGLLGRSKSRLDSIYKELDDDFPTSDEVTERFRHVMDLIGRMLGDNMEQTIYNGEIHFFTLFVYLYDRLWGLGSAMSPRRPQKLPSDMQTRLLKLSQLYEKGDIPSAVRDAVARSSTDLGRRKTRFDFMVEVCG